LNFFVIGFVLLNLTNPGVVEELSYRWPSDLIPVQTLEDKVTSVRRNRGPLFIWEFYLFVDDILINFLDVFPIKWGLSRKELICDNSQAPNINFFGVFLMFDELWGHIKRCPQDQIEARITIKLLSKAQVRNFDIKVIFFIRDQQDIFWLDIPVGNRLQMHII
jgi:hypothetical protein